MKSWGSLHRPLHGSETIDLPEREIMLDYEESQRWGELERPFEP